MTLWSHWNTRKIQTKIAPTDRIVRRCTFQRKKKGRVCGPFSILAEAIDAFSSLVPARRPSHSFQSLHPCWRRS